MTEEKKKKERLFAISVDSRKIQNEERRGGKEKVFRHNKK